MGQAGELAGFSVGVTADRRADEQLTMLDQLGATAVHAPVIRTLPIANGDRLRAVTESLIRQPPDYVVANTALGVRSWLGVAASWGLEAELIAALGAGRIAARSPKSAGAVSVAGLHVWWQAASEQLSEVAARLAQEDLRGKRVAVQLHGDDRQPVSEVLRSVGAEVVEVPVYRWTTPDDDSAVLRLVERACRGTLDAITFTARPAVHNLLAISDRAGRRDDLVAALNGRVLCVCVGPVCGAAASEEGVEQPVIPDQWRMGPMVRALANALRGRRLSYWVDAHEIVLQGRAALVDGQFVALSELERALLGALVARPGALVGRQTLLRQVWRDRPAHPHVVETTVARLRAKLGPAGMAVETVVRRGYRLGSAKEGAESARAEG